MAFAIFGGRRRAGELVQARRLLIRPPCRLSLLRTAHGHRYPRHSHSPSTGLPALARACASTRSLSRLFCRRVSRYDPHHVRYAPNTRTPVLANLKAAAAFIALLAAVAIYAPLSYLSPILNTASSESWATTRLLRYASAAVSSRAHSRHMRSHMRGAQNR